MIELCQGNIFNSPADALVSPVNCVGVSGAGLALEFKEMFPKNFEAYKRMCRLGCLKPGKIFIKSEKLCGRNIIVINLPTKNHFRDNSTLDIIKIGLESLINTCKHISIKSIAIPALGCGLGGLDWKDVKPMIEEAFSTLPELKVYLYEPQ